MRVRDEFEGSKIKGLNSQNISRDSARDEVSFLQPEYSGVHERENGSFIISSHVEVENHKSQKGLHASFLGNQIGLHAGPNQYEDSSGAIASHEKESNISWRGVGHSATDSEMIESEVNPISHSFEKHFGSPLGRSNQIEGCNLKSN